MFIDNPDYPNIVLSFTYQNVTLQLDQGQWEGQTTYAVWVNHDYGCAIAVPCAFSRTEAIRQAKRWVDRRRQQATLP